MRFAVFIYSILCLFLSSVTWASESITIPFDIFVGDQNRGYTAVTYTEDWAEFEAPEQVLSFLSDVKEPDNFLPLFNKPIQKTYRLNGIGEVTIDTDFFKVTITPDPSQLRVQKIAKDEEIDFNKASLSLKQDFALNGVLSSHNNSNYTLRHNTQAYSGPLGTQWQGNITKENGYELTSLAAEYNNGKTKGSLGMLESQGANFSRSQEFWGVSFTPNQRHLFSAQNQAQPLEIFVPQRSNTVILRGDRVIYSAVLDFGLQEIDTSQFPSGSYDIEIITDYNGSNERKETRFFTNNASLVPMGKINWRLSLGSTRNDLESLDNRFLEAYLAKRLTAQTELSLSAVQIGNLRLIEPQFRTVWSNNELKASFVKSNERDLAALMELTHYMRNGSWSISTTKALQGFIHDSSGSILSATKEMARFYITKSFGPVQTSFSANHTTQVDGDRRFNAGAKLRYNIYQDREHLLSFDSSHFNSDSGTNSQIGLQYRYRPDSNNSYQTDIDHQTSQNEDLLLLTQRYQHKDKQGQLKGTEYNALLQHKESNKITQRAEFGTRVYTDKGQIKGLLSQENTSSQQVTNLTFEGNTSFTYGQNQLVQSAHTSDNGHIIVKLNGEGDTLFNVLLNGQKMTTAKAGERVLINVRPFDVHRLSIEPANAEEALVYYSGDARQVRLHKGQIHYESFTVRPVVMLFARVFDKKGLPIAWQHVKSPNSSTLTDDAGNMQFEYTGVGSLSIQGKRHKCTLALPPIPNSSIIHDAGNVLCL